MSATTIAWTFKIGIHQVRQLDAIASVLHMAKAEIVRDAIDEWIERFEADSSPDILERVKLEVERNAEGRMGVPRGSGWKKRRGTAKGRRYAAFISSYAWRKKAAEIKARDGYTCQRCGVTDEERLMTVHHRTYAPILEETPDSELVTWCRECNTGEREERVGFGRRDVR